MGMHLVHQMRHMLGRRELADAVAQVEDVADAARGRIQVGRAKGIQHAAHLGADRIGRGKQHIGVDVALQGGGLGVFRVKWGPGACWMCAGSGWLIRC